MRVALYMDAPQVGGAERYFADLGEGLAEREGVELHILSPDNELVPYLRGRLNGKGTIHVLGPRPDYGDRLSTALPQLWLAFRELRRALRQVRPDLLHVNNGGYPGSHLARAAVFATGSVRVMTVNSRAQPRGTGILELYRVIDPLVWSRVSRVIVPAQAAASAIVEHGKCPPKLVTVIPYGIPEPTLDADEVARVRRQLAPNDELVVGMVVAPSKDAAAVAYKGHDVLLEAAGRLDRRDIRLAIVGHDPGPAFAARAEALGLSDRLSVFAGFRDAQPFMAAFDALAVPSTESEALPLVALEAMASGTPVIGSRLSGIPEAVSHGENGYTFEPGDSDELARVIGACADDRAALRRLGERARETFRERFASREMVDRTVTVYEQVSGSG